MSIGPNIVRARPEDADTLTGIAFAAKRHWGYPDPWLLQWAEALTLTPKYIRTHPTYAATESDAIVGFCAIKVGGREASLDHLWVVPAAMRRGIGRALFCCAEHIARELGAARMTIVGDPHAEGFYRRMGATLYGRRAAPMDGRARFLSLLEKPLIGPPTDEHARIPLIDPT